mgnify:CR=1 FL=1
MLEGLRPPVIVRKTRVEEVLETLDAKDQKILIEALNNPEWSANGLSVALRQRGIKLSQSSIARYRENKK